MADIDSGSPLGDCKPGTFLDSPGGTAESTISALFPLTARAGAVGTPAGVNNPVTRLCVMIEDSGSSPQTTASGRYIRLWNDETKTFYALDGSNLYKQLTNGTNTDPRGGVSDPMDLCMFSGAVFMADGRPRNDPPGMCNRLLLCVTGDAGTGASTIAHDAITGSRPVSTTVTFNEVNNAIYFGAPGLFSGLVIRIGTSGTGTRTVIWEYWNGTTWTALAGVTDNTTGFTAATGNRTVTFTEPTDWGETRVGALPISGNLYWVRARVSAVTSTGVAAVLTSYEVTGNDTVTGAVADDGGVTTDETTLAQTQTANDLTLLPAVPVVNDAYYFGATNTFRSLLLDIGTAGAGTWTITWEYYNGAWTALSGVTDNTSGFKPSAAGFYTVLFTMPTDWTTTTVGGIATKYWIRARVSAFTSVTTQPLGNQAWVFSASRSVSYSCPALMVGDDPGAAAPAFIGWGVDPHDNLSAMVGRFTLDGTGNTRHIEIRPYDSLRDREGTGTVFSISQNGNAFVITALDHNQGAVDSIRVYVATNTSVGSTAASTRYRMTFPDGKDFLAKGARVSFSWTVDTDAPTAGSTVANGPVMDSEYRPTRRGTPISCASGRTRVVAAGSSSRTTATTTNRPGNENFVGWSTIEKGHYFPAGNKLAVSPNDGDEIVAVRELFDQFIIFKRRSIHKLILDQVGGAPPYVAQISVGIGCQARRSIVKAGNVLLFLGPEGVYSLDGGGQISKLALSEPVAKIIQALDKDATSNACAAWWPEMQCYLLAVPGLQEQTSGGAEPDATSGITGVEGPINDGMLVCHVPTATWDIHSGGPIYPASLATMWRTSSSYEVWMGDYFGRVWRSDETVNVDGQVVSGITYSGTVDLNNPSFTILEDSTAVFLTSSTDKRMVGMYLWLYDGTGQGQIRRIVSSTGTQLTIEPAWTTRPASGASATKYAIGHIYWHVELGDWVLGDPFTQKILVHARPLLQTALSASHDLDFAVDPTDVDDSATGYSFAGGTTGTLMPPDAVMLPFTAGYTQRLMMLGRQGNASRPQVKALEVGWVGMGRPGG